MIKNNKQTNKTKTKQKTKQNKNHANIFYDCREETE
jgi:hypothetical protein